MPLSLFHVQLSGSARFTKLPGRPTDKAH